MGLFDRGGKQEGKQADKKEGYDNIIKFTLRLYERLLFSRQDAKGAKAIKHISTASCF